MKATLFQCVKPKCSLTFVVVPLSESKIPVGSRIRIRNNVASTTYWCPVCRSIVHQDRDLEVRTSVSLGAFMGEVKNTLSLDKAPEPEKHRRRPLE